MFDIGGTELLLVVALAVIFIGPKELPRVMRAIGAFARKARAVVSDFQQSFEDLANQADLEKLHREAGEPIEPAEPEPPAPDKGEHK
jgi:sec-independent protein translocase protein TatB